MIEGRGERERVRVEKWKWLTWCHAASPHHIPVGREEEGGAEKSLRLFIRQIYPLPLPCRAAAPLI